MALRKYVIERAKFRRSAASSASSFALPPEVERGSEPTWARHPVGRELRRGREDLLHLLGEGRGDHRKHAEVSGFPATRIAKCAR
jgi:hypothetical protein